MNAAETLTRRAALEALATDRTLTPQQRHFVSAYLSKDPHAYLLGWHRGRPVVHGTMTGLPGEVHGPDAVRHDTVLARGGDVGLADLSENMRDSEHFTTVRP